MRPPLWLAITVAMPSCLLPPPAVAQDRVVDLTGSPAGRIAEPFSRIIGAQPVGGDRVVVSDNIDQAVVVVDFGTQQRLPVARQGQGPGEWQLPSRVIPGPRGSAWLVDPAKRAIHQITSAGQLARSVPWLQLPGEAFGALPRGTDARGEIFVQGTGFGGGGTSDSVPVLRWDPTTGQSDQLTTIPNPVRMQRSSGNTGQFTYRRGSRRPYETRAAWVGLADGGIAMVHPQPYRVDRIDPNGALVPGRELTFEPVRVTAAERKAWRDAQQRQAQQGGSFGGGAAGGGPPVQQARDDEFPATLPPFVADARMLADPDGTVWIPRTSASDAAVRTWDIVRPGAGRVGTARVPNGSTIVAIDGTHIHVVRTDDDTGLQYLERYAR